MLYKLSPHLIEEIRQIKATGKLPFMAAHLRVREEELEVILRLGVVTERWLQWKFICDAVVAVLLTSSGHKAFWKQCKMEFKE